MTGPAASGAATSHTANLLGALTLAMSDRLGDVLAAAAGQSQSGAAALTALHQFLRGPTVDRLARVIGLSQSGAVRLVDRLEAGGYVRRGPGADARSITVTLTAAGTRVARRIETARLRLLEQVISPLGEADRAILDALLGRVLAGLLREAGAIRWTCRLCDLAACGREAGRCPVEQEARRRYG